LEKSFLSPNSSSKPLSTKQLNFYKEFFFGQEAHATKHPLTSLLVWSKRECFTKHLPLRIIRRKSICSLFYMHFWVKFGEKFIEFWAEQNSIWGQNERESYQKTEGERINTRVGGACQTRWHLSHSMIRDNTIGKLYSILHLYAYKNSPHINPQQVEGILIIFNLIFVSGSFVRFLWGPGLISCHPHSIVSHTTKYLFLTLASSP